MQRQQLLLKETWFAEVRSDEKYDADWVREYVQSH